jgi:hypothetical protein
VPPASDHGATPAVERFDYSRVGTEWAVLSLLARLGSNLGAPAGVGLVVRRGLEAGDTVYPARAGCYERRLLGIAAGDPDGSASELLWRASFAVPLAVVEFQHARFELTADGGLALGLPTPGIRILAPRTLRLAPAGRRGHASPGLGVAGSRQRLAALATAVAVTATSAPAVALAAAGTASGPTPSAAPAHAGSAERVKAAERLALALARESARKAAARPPTATASVTAKRATPTRATTGMGAAAGAKPAGRPEKPGRAAAGKASASAPGEATGKTSASAPGKATGKTSASAPGKATGKTSASAPGKATGKASASAHGRSHRTAMAVTDPMATTAPVPPSKRRTSTIGHLTHPKVTHIFSAPAAPAPHLPTTPDTGTTGTSTTGTTGTGTGTTGTGTGTTGTGTGTTGTTGTGTTGAAPPTNTGKGTTPPKPGTTLPKPGTTVPKPGGGDTGMGTPGTGGSLTPTPPAPVAKRREQTSSRPGVQPLGGLSSKPPVKLSSHTDGGAAPAGNAPATAPGTAPTWSSTPGFNGPASWTGSVSTDPSLAGAVSNLSDLLANGNRPPQFLVPIYMQAGRRYGIRWQVLAAINAIESNYGRNLSTSSAGAMGWMQFMPSTWKEWGVAVDGHSVPNPYDPRDAIFSAARYLAAAGGARDITRAIFAYNHAGWYVDEVMARANAIATHALYTRATVNKHGTFSVFFSTHRKRRPVIRYRGGLLSHYDRLISAANMVSAANFPYVYAGGHEQPARFEPFDCSGSVSYVMQQAGYKVPTEASGGVPVWKFPAGPGRVTIFYNPGHTFMRIGNRYFGTSGFARPGGGAGWFSTNKLPAGYLAQFREVHVPKLGPNSFAPEHRKTTSS